MGGAINFVKGKVELRCYCRAYAVDGASIQVIWDDNFIEPRVSIHGDVKSPRLIVLQVLNFSIVKIDVKF